MPVLKHKRKYFKIINASHKSILKIKKICDLLVCFPLKVFSFVTKYKFPSKCKKLNYKQWKISLLLETPVCNNNKVET